MLAPLEEEKLCIPTTLALYQNYHMLQTEKSISLIPLWLSFF